MKLILCHSCQDVFKFGKMFFKSCRCGNVKARYINDLDGEFFAKDDHYSLIGFANSSLSSSIKEYIHTRKEDGYPLNSWGLPFTAFVIPEPCSTIKRLDEKTYSHISNKMIEDYVIDATKSACGVEGVTKDSFLRKELGLDNVSILSIIINLEKKFFVSLFEDDTKSQLRKLRKVNDISKTFLRKIG